jgi:hypothetical protein
MTTDAAVAGIAEAFGRHALPWFLAGLAATIALAGGTGRWLLGHSRLEDRARIASVPGSALRLMAGFGVIVAAAAVFAAIAGELGGERSPRSTPHLARRGPACVASDAAGVRVAHPLRRHRHARGAVRRRRAARAARRARPRLAWSAIAGNRCSTSR